MDFFDRQERAQRRTKWLVAYFLLAIAGIILTLHIAFALILKHPIGDWQLLGMIAGSVIVAVTVGSIIKIIQLSQGGRVVATMLGGIQVDMNSADPAERRLINVVEEMAIASGVPVPEIYILEETTINAFAAGHGPGDAVIGVTRGGIENLSRDELQGVIGHEFSHILHGDMRLNLRLMGLLNGILFLAIIGGFLLRIGSHTRTNSSSRDSQGKGGSIIMFLLLGGVALYLIGYIGVFFGKLIKAAVSRQREFLADASAVQYTRNPEGLAGALAKLQKFSSNLQSLHAEEASHLFFGNGVGNVWLKWFATHPPIEERIRQIAPQFDIEAALQGSSPLQSKKKSNMAGGRLREALLPGQPQVMAATALLASLPDFSKKASHELEGAQALIYSLLLSESESIRKAQVAELEAGIQAETLNLFEKRGELSSAQRISLVDISIPALRQMSPEQYTRFRDNIKKLVEADGQIHLFEYALQKILRRHLALYFTKSTGTPIRYKSILPLLPDIGVLLSALAIYNSGSKSDQETAFHAGASELLIKAPLPMHLEAIDLKSFDRALDHLGQATPAIKRTILKACGAVVMHDGKLHNSQIELLRAIADALDCPIPPFVHVS